jgi:hypothetical protein
MGEDSWLDAYWEDRISGIGEDFQDEADGYWDEEEDE